MLCVWSYCVLVCVVLCVLHRVGRVVNRARDMFSLYGFVEHLTTCDSIRYQLEQLLSNCKISKQTLRFLSESISVYVDFS